jgi:hypothetical protein
MLRSVPIAIPAEANLPVRQTDAAMEAGQVLWKDKETAQEGKRGNEDENIIIRQNKQIKRDATTSTDDS